MKNIFQVLNSAYTVTQNTILPQSGTFRPGFFELWRKKICEHTSQPLSSMNISIQCSGSPTQYSMYFRPTLQNHPMITYCTWTNSYHWYSTPKYSARLTVLDKVQTVHDTQVTQHHYSTTVHVLHGGPYMVDLLTVWLAWNMQIYTLDYHFYCTCCMRWAYCPNFLEHSVGW